MKSVINLVLTYYDKLQLVCYYKSTLYTYFSAVKTPELSVRTLQLDGLSRFPAQILHVDVHQEDPLINSNILHVSLSFIR
jgi:hypothetical protein